MVSIIIVNYKNPPLLRLCLNSLHRALSADFDYEVVVVDSSTSLETEYVVTEEFKNKFKEIRHIPFTENTWYTRGINEGLKTAQGDYMLMLNNDIVTLENSIEKLTDYLKNNPNVGLLGPQLLNFDGSRQDSCFRFYTPLTVLYRRIGHLPFASRIIDHFLMRDADISKPTSVNWLMGSAFMTSRTVLNKVGLLDEKLVHYFSDVDWARRFWENGYRVVYYPDAKLYHYLGRKSKGKFGLFDILFNPATRLHVRDAVRYFQKYGVKAPQINLQNRVPLASNANY